MRRAVRTVTSVFREIVSRLLEFGFLLFRFIHSPVAWTIWVHFINSSELLADFNGFEKVRKEIRNSFLKPMEWAFLIQVELKSDVKQKNKVLIWGDLPLFLRRLAWPGGCVPQAREKGVVFMKRGYDGINILWIRALRYYIDWSFDLAWSFEATELWSYFVSYDVDGESNAPLEAFLRLARWWCSIPRVKDVLWSGSLGFVAPRVADNLIRCFGQGLDAPSTLGCQTEKESKGTQDTWAELERLRKLLNGFCETWAQAMLNSHMRTKCRFRSSITQASAVFLLPKSMALAFGV